MSAGGFWREVGVGFALSVAGALTHFLFAPMLGAADSMRLVVLLVSAAYGFFLFPSLGVRVGRIVLSLAWCALVATLAVFDPGLVFWMGAQIGFFWFVRVLYRHDGLIPAALDAGLCVLACAAVFATASHTHSLFLSLWALFLVQALWRAVPNHRDAHQADSAEADPGEERFDQAYRSAEAALRRLSTPAG